MGLLEPDYFVGLLGKAAPAKPKRLLGGLYDPDGFPVDLKRPVLKNDDGSISTEESMTVGLGGAFYNIPTIVGGARVDEDAAISNAINAMRAGYQFPNFQTLEEALGAAKRRTEFLGTLRK